MTDSSLDSAPMDAAAQPKHRHIQSFVHRRSHFSKAQQTAYAELLPVWGVAYQPQLIDFASLFGNAHPVVFEIGCGMGETTAAIALANPQVNFLGIEVYNAGVATLLQRIDALGLTNLRLIQHDAIDVLNHMIAPHALAGVHIFCPDPWPKARHLKRRLVQPHFMDLILPRLARGAYVHCATDVQDYAVQMLAVLSATVGLTNLSTAEDGYHPPHNPIAQRGTTKFEARGQRLGHGMWDVVFEKT